MTAAARKRVNKSIGIYMHPSAREELASIRDRERKRERHLE